MNVATPVAGPAPSGSVELNVGFAKRHSKSWACKWIEKNNTRMIDASLRYDKFLFMFEFNYELEMQSLAY